MNNTVSIQKRKDRAYTNRKNQRLQRKLSRSLGIPKTYSEIFTLEHLILAYNLNFRGTNWKKSTQEFKLHFMIEINRILKALNLKTFNFKPPVSFTIIEKGVERMIKSMRIDERLVLRTLCDQSLLPTLSNTFIYDNGAGQFSKGATFAFDRIKQHLRAYVSKYGTDGYILQIDFRKFFDTLSHDAINRILREHYDDEDVIALINKVLAIFDPDKTGKGTGLGCLTSPPLALAIASKVDHYAKDRRSAKYYGRYMDDAYLISNSKEELEDILVGIREVCMQWGITVNERKTKITPLHRGFKFLKARINITPTGKILMRPDKKGIVRVKRKLKALRYKVESGILSMDDIHNAVCSSLGWLKWFNAYRSSKEIVKQYNEIYADYADRRPIDLHKIRSKKAYRQRQQERKRLVYQIDMLFRNEKLRAA